MKPVKIAMMGMTHGHTRKYYQTLIENQKLDWVASCAADERAGVTRSGARGLNCGICGFDGCADCLSAGSACAFETIDLGIALGSAVSLAADKRVDTRIMYTIGRTAVKCGLLARSEIAMGIPVSISGKSPFFDRG